MRSWQAPDNDAVGLHGTGIPLRGALWQLALCLHPHLHRRHAAVSPCMQPLHTVLAYSQPLHTAMLHLDSNAVHSLQVAYITVCHHLP